MSSAYWLERSQILYCLTSNTSNACQVTLSIYSRRNLCGPDLSASERALFTAARKRAYEALHPETRAGVAGANASNRVQGNATAKLAVASFAEDQSAKTGASTRSVFRDAERAKALGEDLQRISGTSLDVDGPFKIWFAATRCRQQTVETMRERTALRGPYRLVNDTFLRKRAADDTKPTHIFYKAMLRNTTYEAYLADVGPERVDRPGFKAGPTNGRGEILYCRRGGRIADA